ncbi:MAG: uroporphyrinogen-III C-methyltransferase [Alphaproteobacteria bacterium]
MTSAGRVFLVGAGPGDPDLLTLKAWRLLGKADALVYDRLVSPAILDLVPPGAARIDVGKQLGNHPVPQEEINDTLIRLARGGRIVVRLKGGDPFMFGRGGEEALALMAAGIPFEVVPGITSAQGTAASLNVPLTHRGIASGVRYLTGHCRADAKLDFDWEGLADPETTLVIYMGLSNIREITAQLMAHGLDPETPAIAVANATRPDQTQLVSTLGRLAVQARAADLSSPAIFIIGEVVRLATTLGTLSNAPSLEEMVAAE